MKRLLPLALIATLSGAPARLAPALNWVLPLFTKEGFHSMTLRGAQVHPISPERIDVVDLNITVFSGDAAARVRTVLLSSEASFFPRENRASGPGSVRVIEEDAEITGEDWTYQRSGEKVSLHRNVRVVFQESIGNLLR
jgi:hypothetical protein